MNGWLRSWKLCKVTPEVIDGVPGWRKRRLGHATLLIPPGNIFLHGIDSGCRMFGAGWAAQEVAVFRRTHDDVAAPRWLDRRTIWLPHLAGAELRQDSSPEADLLAFAELGRFHRLHDRSVHGDPHAGNFLYDRESGRCRIIDFETTIPIQMTPEQGRARDFAILALDLWKRGTVEATNLSAWQDAYGNDEDFCPVGTLLRHPGFLLKGYWRLLGYRPPAGIG
jgi:hypothetical protein